MNSYARAIPFIAILLAILLAILTNGQGITL